MWRYALPLLVVIALGVLLFQGIGRDPSTLPSPLIDHPVPAFELGTLADPSVRVSQQDLLGEPYLLNVFASWCATCHLEHPVLKAFAEEGVARLIGLNWKDQPDDAKRWLVRAGDPYALILADESGAVGIDLGVYGTPETFLVDANGVIRFKHVGELTDAVIEREIRPRLLAWSDGTAP